MVYFASIKDKDFCEEKKNEVKKREENRKKGAHTHTLNGYGISVFECVSKWYVMAWVVKYTYKSKSPVSMHENKTEALPSTSVE